MHLMDFLLAIVLNTAYRVANSSTCV